MASNERAEEIAARIFRDKKRRRLALARLPIEQKVQIIARMQAIAEEIRTIARASHQR